MTESILMIRNGTVISYDSKKGSGVFSEALRHPIVQEKTTVIIEGDRIVWLGSETELPEEYAKHNAADIIDASGKLVTAGLIDCHTHTIFAGTRQDEFEKKLQGVPYMKIAAEGGGIKRTVGDTRKASEDELIDSGVERLDKALNFGITTVEVKSGYGLNLETEVKMLRAAAKLQEVHVVDVIPTFLGAHEMPPEVSSKQDYLDTVLEEMIPHVGESGLAEFCDVFCEEGVFTVDESRRVLQKGCQYGMKPKIHAEQLTDSGGAELAGEVKAISADHLEYISSRGIEALKKNQVIPVLLPGCDFFMGMDKYPDARRLINAGLPVALATDFNPGSCMTQNLPLIMTKACTQMKMTPDEVLGAATVNAAYAVARGEDRGNICVGQRADLLIVDVPDIAYWMYHFGENHVHVVIKDGIPVWLRD